MLSETTRERFVAVLLGREPNDPLDRLVWVLPRALLVSVVMVGSVLGLVALVAHFDAGPTGAVLGGVLAGVALIEPVAERLL